TGHLIYFRFFQKVLKDMGMLSDDEPASRLYNHGMVSDASGEMMSKSKGNVVSPVELMGNYGCDVIRLAMYFTAPSGKEVLWDDSTITGLDRFIKKSIFPLVNHFRKSEVDLKHHFNQAELTGEQRKIYVKLNQVVRKVSDSYDQLHFNTAISALMELVRDFGSGVDGHDSLHDSVILKTIQMIAPMAPHIAEEMWQLTGHSDSVFKSGWPMADPEALVGDMIEIAVQVNGKLRDTVIVAADAGQAEVEKLALVTEKIVRHIDGKQVIKKIYVPGRLINIVVKG
ncbi:MAG: class I tRNA ligase family protein, partial [candidate division Zixibacteria bacterium]